MSTLKPNAPTPGPWTVGRERILELIESGELERVVVNREYAQGLCCVLAGMLKHGASSGS